MRMEVETARTVKCVVYGTKLEYRGYGRPPKYSEKARKEIEAKKRRDRYAAKKAAAKKSTKSKRKVH